MKIYQSSEIKNFSLLGASGSGKTTLIESMLLESEVIKRRGTVEAGTTVSDYFPVEKEYGYSVFPTINNIEFLGKKLNIIDCPGSDDFVGGAITSLNITDTAIILVSAQNGIEVGTQSSFRYAAEYKKPVIFLLNKLDHAVADYDRTVEAIHATYGNKAVAIQFPVNVGPNFNALVDVLKMKMYVWKPEGGKPEIKDIPAELMGKAEELHGKLLEAAAENDETLMDKYFEQGELSEDEMRAGIRAGMAMRDVFPIFCVCAGKDMGVRRLMEFLGNIAPSVDQTNPMITTEGEEIKCKDDAPTSIYVFKTSVEPHIGEVNYFKVAQGVLRTGDDLQNMDRNSKERISQIFAVDGSIRTQVDELHAGDIGATVKLKDTRTGNTLNAKGADFTFGQIKYPRARYRRSVKAVNQGENEKMMQIIARQCEEDPTWRIEVSKELRQTIVSGMGEFHLRTLKWRLENNEKIQIEYGEPKIPYRETITKAARADYRHKKQSGGAGQFGEVHLIVEPYVEGVEPKEIYKFGGQEYKITPRDTQEVELEWGGKLVMVNSIVGGAIDARFMPAILKGLMDKMESGPLTGSYARDVRVIVYDGKMHPVDSNELSFRLAARNAFAQAFREAGPKVLEPIYEVTVLTPSDKMGDVMSDMQNRRGVILGMSSESGYEKLTARVPLAEIGNYSTTLSSLSGGRANFTMEPAEYQLVPGDVQEKLLAAYAAEAHDEE